MRPDRRLTHQPVDEEPEGGRPSATRFSST